MIESEPTHPTECELPCECCAASPADSDRCPWGSGSPHPAGPGCPVSGERKDNRQVIINSIHTSHTTAAITAVLGLYQVVHEHGNLRLNTPMCIPSKFCVFDRSYLYVTSDSIHTQLQLTHPLNEVQALSIVHPVNVSPVNAFPAVTTNELVSSTYNQLYQQCYSTARAYKWLHRL